MLKKKMEKRDNCYLFASGNRLRFFISNSYNHTLIIYFTLLTLTTPIYCHITMYTIV